MENKNVKLAEDQNLEVQVQESKLENFGTKVKTGVKKHGKKVATIVGLGIVGALGYALGVKVGKNSCNDDVEVDADEEYVDYSSDELE